MRKFLAILVLGLLFSNNAYAELDAYINKYSIEERKGEDNYYYNLLIKNYNNFIKDSYNIYSLDCKNLPGSITPVTNKINCEYEAVKKYMRRHKINIKEIVDAEHDLYIQMHERANALDKLFLIGPDNIVKKSISDFVEFQNYEMDKTAAYIKNVWLKYAINENLIYLSAKKDKEPKIPDNKIISASSGSGFFVSKQGHLVTNYHVIDGCKDIKVFYKNNAYIANTLATDKINDLAILKIDQRVNQYYVVSDKDPELLENVIIAGFPLGKNVSESIKTSKGSITALSGYGDNFSEFQTDAALNSGNSGGPIMNEKGEVVGVAVAAFGKKEGIESFNFGIKNSTLRTFAKANKIELETPSMLSFFSPDLKTLVSEGTTYIECWMTGAALKAMLKQKNSRKAFFTQYKK